MNRKLHLSSIALSWITILMVILGVNLLNNYEVRASELITELCDRLNVLEFNSEEDIELTDCEGLFKENNYDKRIKSSR